jgi:hypothetical protein
MHRLRFLAGSIVLLLTATFALAQTGSIQGTVTDSAGAVVQGAEIAVKNLGSNVVRTATSGGTGAYSIPSLPPANYEITIKMASFKTFHVTDLQLTVAQVLSVNAQLEPGAVAEEVEVRADQISSIDFETSQISNLVDQRSIIDLPLITRNPYELVLLSPGTSQTNALGGITVNGSRERNNNFLLDGVDNNDTSVPGGLVTALGADPDSTQEFRVITNNFNAEYGRNTGAIIDVVTKSGTNQFHGDAYEFGRWNSFGGARDWFNRPADGPQDPYIRHQFGFSIGGPIRKDKTFFFFNDEMDRFITTLTNAATVPTAAFKTGIFNYTSIDPNTLGSTTVPVDITETGANNYSTLGYPLPPAPADPTMQKIFALYPKPTFDNGDGFSGTLLYPSSSRTSSYTTVFKLDHHFTDRQTFSVRYGYDGFHDPDPFHDDILPGQLGSAAEKSIAQALAANLVSSFTTNFLNSFTFAYNRIFAGFKCNGLSVLDSVAPLDRFGRGTDYILDPFSSFGCISELSDNQARKTGTDSYSDSISWVHGAHTWKFGGDFRNIHEDGNTNFTSRRQADTRTFINTGLSLLQGVPNTSVALEDAVSAFYGFVWKDVQGEFFNKAGVRQPTDDKNFRQHEYDWYGQDTWKIRRNFTLTYGLRYQLDGVPYEEKANFSNLLSDPAGPAPLVMSIVGPGTGKQIYNSDYSNVEPRVGFSWDPWNNGRTAIRGGFGIFHDRIFGNLFGNARANPPFEQDYVVNPFETLNNFFGGALNGQLFVLPSPPDTVPSATIPQGAQLEPILFDTHFRNPSSNNWNFGIQRDLVGGNTLDLAYVGSKGTHIFRQVDGNPPDPNLVKQLVAFCSVPNSFGCTPATVTKSNLYIGADGNFPSLPFNAVQQNAIVQPFYQRSIGNSIYHSLQLKVTHRMSHGLQLQGAYTWAHGIDDSNDPLAPNIGNRAFPRNSRDLAEERGNSDNDVRHIGVISYIWEAPVGKGKSYLNNGFVGKVFEGIQFSGITSAQTGHPFDVFSTTDMERTGLSGRADLVGNPFAPGSNTQASAGGAKVWFTNPAAFSLRTDANGGPLFVGPGSVGRNHFYGPGLVDFDLTFAKKMNLTERFVAELRVECYNIFNHPHFNNPGSDAAVNGNLVGQPIFGLITNTVGRSDGTTSARQMQVALKLSF